MVVAEEIVYLSMASSADLEILYDQLFGIGDVDEHDVAASAAGLSVQACTHGPANNSLPRPTIFDQPRGLLLFKKWFNREQQVAYDKSCIPSVRDPPHPTWLA